MWRRRLLLSASVIAFVASFFAYARRTGDFAGYVAAGNAVLQGRDIYLDTPPGVNTWPPFFSFVSVPLALLDRVSPYFVRVVWIALTWASILWALDLIAKMVYGKRLAFRPSENSLGVESPELLVPFALTLPYFINNFELLQINSILFALVLWGLYLQANGRETGGGFAIGAAAAMKVMAIAFLPYFLYRKRWRTAFWIAIATAIFSVCPILFLGWSKFSNDVALWLVALHGSWSSGNAEQSVYAMWDRILGYGYAPFAVPGKFLLPMSGARTARLAWEISCAIAAVLGLAAFRGAPAPDSFWAKIEWATVFVASTILSPLTRKPYLVVMLLPNALLYSAWRSSLATPHVRRILGTVLLVSFACSLPTLHDLIGKSLAVRLEMGSIVTFGVLILLGGLLWYRWRAPLRD